MERKPVAVASWESFNREDLSKKTTQFHRAIMSAEVEKGGSLYGLVSAAKGQEPQLYREVFADLYDGQLEKNEEGAPGWAEIVAAKLDESPEYQKLKRECAGITWQASLATASLGSSLLAHILAEVRPAEESAEKLQRQIDDAEAMPGLGMKEALDELRAKLAAVKAQNAQAAQNASNLNKHIIKQHVNTVRKQGADAAAALAGFGLAPLAKQSAPDQQFIEQISKNKKFALIAKLAGQMRLALHGAQGRRDAAAPEELFRLTLGSDITKAIPSELALLADEDAEDLILHKIVEGNLISFDLRGRPPFNLGPIVVAIDESGSMSGGAEIVSKAALIALAQFAGKTNRSFCSVHFDDDVSRVVRIKGPPSANDLSQILHFTGGGTDIAEALRSCGLALNEGEFNRADVLLITDGMDGNPQIPIEIQNLHAKKARVFALLTAGDEEFGGMFDQCFELTSAFNDEEAIAQTIEAVKEAAVV